MVTVELALESCSLQKIANRREDRKMVYGEKQAALSLRSKFPAARPKPDTLTTLYNCHGLTFAARRTAIETGIEGILVQDGYIEVQFHEVWPGDVVVYYSNGPLGTEAIHTAIAMHKKDLALWVLSKWGGAEEYLHIVGDCPYLDTHKRYFRKS